MALRTLKPSHVKAIAALLEEGAETSEELAKSVMRKFDELREDDKTYMIVGQWDSESGSYYLGYGPYATKKQAEKAIEKGKGVPVIAEHIAIVPTFTPEHIERVWAKADEPPPPPKWVKEVQEDIEHFKTKPKKRRRRW